MSLDAPCRVQGRALDLLLRSDAPVVLTGASGWFGRCLLEALLGALGPAGVAARVHAYSSRGLPVALRGGHVVPTRRFDDLGRSPLPASVVLHFAYLTKEQAVGMPLERYVEANRGITARLFEALAAWGSQALFMPSSGAVYRAHVTEPDWSAVNAYGKLKLEDERLALDWAARTPGARAIVCRVFNVSGPYINKYGDYALSSAIDSALRGLPIRIRTPKHTLRSYVAVDELLSLVLGLLLEPGQPSVRFDSAGDAVVEIDDLVHAVRRVLDVDAALERPPRVPEEDRYLGQREAYAALLRQFAIAGASLDEQIVSTAAYIRQFPGA